MSIISYFGGKSSKVFLEFINSKIPKSGIKTYIEPFSGSMGTYLDDDNLNFEKVIFNDKNRHQVNLVYCCSKPKEFLEHLEKFKSTILSTTDTDPIEKWNFYKGIYQKFTKNSFLDDMNFDIGDFKRASMYAFLITSSFSSVYPRGGGFSGYKKDKDRLKLEVLIDKLRKNKYTKKLQSISEFLNTDFETLINTYDSEDTYLYLDPPYARMSDTKDDDSKRLSWYGSDAENVFGPASHRRLLELLKSTKCKWALSYYYFPLLEELLPKDKYFWTQKEVFRSSAQGGNNHEIKKDQSKGIELLIMNYDPNS